MSMTAMTPIYRMLLLTLCLALAVPAAAQDGAGVNGDFTPAEREQAQPAMRIGVHAAVQTNLLRYQVYPYTGEYQAVTDESTAFGISLQFPVAGRWSLLAEITRVRQTWALRQDGEPRFALRRGEHATWDFPFLLVYRPPVPVIPLYVAAGPQVMLATKTDDAFELTYGSFSERGGWKENLQTFDQTALRLAAAAEIGLDLPLSRTLSMQLSMRFSHPFVRAVETELLSIRDFSYWRLRTGLLLQL
ncbi:MAG: hypothetical protein RRA94_12455 [Bacteroidota bacterium]|nr:hypothetical protein [Bacteroidota bacterium]